MPERREMQKGTVPRCKARLPRRVRTIIEAANQALYPEFA